MDCVICGGTNFESVEKAIQPHDFTRRNVPGELDSFFVFRKDEFVILVKNDFEARKNKEGKLKEVLKEAIDTAF